ncbi:MAG: hydantoinase/oxoprolinase family protein [Candidatus Caldarchaeum sp.]|nr:hydantoinase/oxoprolinase family protein [Candidatus Caldarchaeum sp.]
MLHVAVDVGGTFTDLVGFDDESGEIYAVKVRSTPRSPEQGFLRSLTLLAEKHGVDLSSVKTIIHVNTIGTNLLRGQVGLEIPKTALLTTRGFRDVLEIGRQNRPELYNIFYSRPKPLVPRELRLEVDERVDSRGNVIKELDVAEVDEIAEKLVAEKVETVAVSFLESYVNPVNEKKAKQRLEEKTRIPVTASYEVDPEHREYERTSTTVVNAVLKPVVSRYFDAVMRRLGEVGVKTPLQIMSSAGGLVDIRESLDVPVATIESGPAAGVIGAAELASRLGIRNIISLDMGGTTAKAGAVVDGQPLYVPEMEVGGKVHMGRMVKGSGYPVRYPSVDLAEVSAGGGTIIDVDESGGLMVGPMSAGADPGPACYGYGGTMATITDANLVLGRVETLLGGEFVLRKDLADAAVGRVAAKLGSDVAEVASAALALVNHQMARAVHLVSLERGYNPADFVLMAFGGAGPMHAAELAQQIGISTVVVPPHPGLFTSLGLLMTDFRYTFVRGFIRNVSQTSEEDFENIFAGMEADALNRLRDRGLDIRNAVVLRSLDMRYFGQGHELEVRVDRPFKAGETINVFENLHEAVYGFRHSGETVEATAARLTVIIPRAKIRLKQPGTGRENVKSRVRQVYFEGEWLETNAVKRETLPMGYSAEGPLIVEEYDSTTVVPPGWRLEVDGLGCMVMKKV